MKYVVNFRGRALEKENKDADQLIAQGFVEITKQQFMDQRYFPEFDKGPNHQIKAVYKESPAPTKAVSQERKVFHTTIV